MMKTAQNCLVLLAALTLTCQGQRSGESAETLEDLQAVVMEITNNFNVFKAQCTADLNRLQGELDSLKSTVATARLHSAFLAQFTATKVTVTSSGPLLFDNAIFNDGSNYDPTTGIYRVPFSGVYVFTVKTFSGEHETQRPAVDIIRNGQTVDRLAYDYLSSQAGHGGESHSLALTLRLTEGDKVWVQMVAGYGPDEFYGGFHTSFSGALLRAD